MNNINLKFSIKLRLQPLYQKGPYTTFNCLSTLFTPMVFTYIIFIIIIIIIILVKVYLVLAKHSFWVCLRLLYQKYFV